MNPWEKLKPLNKPDRIIEDALAKAARESRKIAFKGKLETVRRKERIRIMVVYRSITTNLRRAYKIVNAYLYANDFYKDLVGIYYSEDDIMRSRRELRNMLVLADKLRDEYLNRLRVAKTIDEMGRVRKECLGRLVSIIKRKKNLLHKVLEMWKYAHRLPSINIDEPTVVVAGPPNVGKSTLVNTLSTAQVKVASYPFTTKDIHVGHIITDYYKIQLIDTPGLLDRPLSERNEVEMKAVVALKHLSDIIIYMFDPSPFRYYNLDEQLSIYNEIKKSFGDALLIPVVNKIDIMEIDVANYLDERSIIMISLKDGVGVDLLRNRVLSMAEDVFNKKKGSPPYLLNRSLFYTVCP